MVTLAQVPSHFPPRDYSSRNSEKIWSAEWGGKIVYCHGTKHSSGTLIMFNPSLDIEVEN